MIKYQLICNEEHTFDSWFASSAAFDALSSSGDVACPSCGSADVRKAVMAPNVSPSTRKHVAAEPAVANESESPAAPAASRPAQLPQPAAEATPVAMDAETRKKFQQLLTAVRQIRKELVATSENVGPKFAEEARKIHFEEAEPRSIYGEATPEEARSLAEDGVDFFALPKLPEDYN